MVDINKNQPSQDWIRHLQQRFPCEQEIDRVLTRKLQRRAGPGYTPVTLDELVKGSEALIGSTVRDSFRITDARWLSGGASKLQMAFQLDWNSPDHGRTSTPLVLRMEPSESIAESSRLREFQVIKAIGGEVPVPEAFRVDAEGTFLPYPAIIYGFAEGVTKPSQSSSGVSGVGTFFPPHLRQPLGAQFVEHLARIHTFDWAGADLGAFDKPAPGTQAVEWELNHWERVWEEDANEDVPLMRLAMAWLRSNMPPVDHVSLLHGDYRTGNFLFTEHDGRISAWLDWELASLGDRHSDIAWATNTQFGQRTEGSDTFLVGGFMSREAFFAAYEKATGLPVIPETLRFYDILGLYKLVVLCLGTGYRAPRNGKTHQDVLVAWLVGITYPMLDQLRMKLEEVL
ncbi:phosphotransferase family protein [Pseudomonas sp. GD03721]|nr:MULTISPECIES: phosphotransferase family protein [unclassified Pseudomonas]MDH1440440.1 phosphotransferase family protein [Pseudomonas sp. GD03722]WGG03472.1 phosphotransferase family protein [Pseudomonas sp. GD03721]WGG07640.1 phosphotransferase family protein [Pseudomonas sp. GD03919]